MRIIISPAKKMNTDAYGLPWQDLPQFFPQAEELKCCLQAMSYEALKKLWKCNDSIAALNAERLKSMDLHRNLTPAILAYEGIQYQYMMPSVFTDAEYAYIQEHLRILSGFYGILRPFDGVVPYRLEMQAKLKVRESKDLYSYWNNRIAEQIFSETDCVLNLASQEYSLCVSRYLKPGVQFITCVFGEEKNGKIIEKGTLCKMARGEMVRWMAENKIQNPNEIKAFHRLDYCFSPAHSDENTFVFLRTAVENPTNEMS